MSHTPTKAHAPGKTRLQWTVQILGELLITAGFILLLFVAWQLWWTNIAADRSQAQAVDSLVKNSVNHAPLPIGTPKTRPNRSQNPRTGRRLVWSTSPASGKTISAPPPKAAATT